MTKAELVRQIADESGVSADIVMTVVETFMKTTKDVLAKGDSIFMRGFGTFTTKERAAKAARDISRGTPIDIPAHRVPTFKPCNEFKDKVRLHL